MHSAKRPIGMQLRREGQVGGQCLIIQSQLPYDSIVRRPCTMDVVDGRPARRMASMMCAYPLVVRDQSSTTDVYMRRHSQKGTRSPRANDCALPRRVSRVALAWVAMGALFPPRPRRNISCTWSGHVGVVPTFFRVVRALRVIPTSFLDEFLGAFTVVGNFKGAGRESVYGVSPTKTRILFTFNPEVVKREREIHCSMIDSLLFDRFKN